MMQIISLNKKCSVIKNSKVIEALMEKAESLKAHN